MTMNLSPKTRRIALTVLGLTFLLAFVFALLPGAGGEAEASTRCGTEFYYYSDATYTEVVGVWGWLPTSCGCQSYSWGTITPYRTVQDSYC
jgi:hypothetical protein